MNNLINELMEQGTPSKEDALIILNLRAKIKAREFNFNDLILD